MGICSEMLETILAPMHTTSKPGGARETISEEREISGKSKNGKFLSSVFIMLHEHYMITLNGYC